MLIPECESFCNPLTFSALQMFITNEVGLIEYDGGLLEYRRIRLMGLFEYGASSTGNPGRNHVLFWS